MQPPKELSRLIEWYGLRKQYGVETGDRMYRDKYPDTKTTANERLLSSMISSFTL